MTVVLHLDVDNFYCAVETADDPSLAGRPLAVMQTNSGGFVALSAEAKAAGLRKGDGVGARGRSEIDFLRRMGSMGVVECHVKCPGLVVLPMRTDRYREAGAAILTLLQQRKVPVEKTSYDDFYIDATSLCEARAETPGTSTSSDTCTAEEDLSRVLAWSNDVASWSDLAPELQRGAKLAVALRRELKQSLGFTASVGVGRSKIVARMLSPEAKPDGVLTLADSEQPAFMYSRRIRSLPGLQAKRGREATERLSVALASGRQVACGDHGHATGDAAESFTLGDAMRLRADELSRCVGAADAALLARLARGDGGASVVARSALPKQVASEVSFPPTDEVKAVAEVLRGLCLTLWRRLLAERPQRGRRPPQRLILSWRDGYPRSTSGHGAMHSRSVPWPPQLATALLKAAGAPPSGSASSGSASSGSASSGSKPSSSFASTSDAVTSDAAAAAQRHAEALAASSLQALLSRLPLQPKPQITRLVVAADFGVPVGDSGGGGGVNSGGGGGGLERFLVGPSKQEEPTPVRQVAAGEAASRVTADLEEAHGSAAHKDAASGEDAASGKDAALGKDAASGEDAARTGGEWEIEAFDEWEEADEDEMMRGWEEEKWEPDGGMEEVEGVPRGAEEADAALADGEARVASSSCPICGKVLQAEDNALVNAHVDACLGRASGTPAPVASVLVPGAAAAAAKSARSKRKAPGAGGGGGGGGSAADQRQRTLLGAWACKSS